MDLPRSGGVQLPDSVLPSATELDRALQTITIDPGKSVFALNCV